MHWNSQTFQTLSFPHSHSSEGKLVNQQSSKTVCSLSCPLKIINWASKSVLARRHSQHSLDCLSPCTFQFSHKIEEDKKELDKKKIVSVVDFSIFAQSKASSVWVAALFMWCSSFITQSQSQSHRTVAEQWNGFYIVWEACHGTISWRLLKMSMECLAGMSATWKFYAVNFMLEFMTILKPVTFQSIHDTRK